MRLFFLALTFSLLGGLGAHAQSTSGCERKQTEEEYQACIERGGNDKSFDPQDWGTGTISPPTTLPVEPDLKDALPAESQRQVRREMAKKVYAKGGEWTPDTRNQQFDYEPSKAAKSDPELKAREEAAFAEALNDYHNREQEVFEAGNAGGNGDKGGSEGGRGNVSVDGDVNAAQGGEQGRDDAGGQSRSAIDILGDLNVLGSPAGTPGETGTGSPPAAGDPQVIAGDVTVGGAQSSTGASDGEQGSSGSENGTETAQNGQGGADQPGPQGDQPNQPNAASEQTGEQGQSGTQRSAEDAFGDLAQEIQNRDTENQGTARDAQQDATQTTTAQGGTPSNTAQEQADALPEAQANAGAPSSSQTSDSQSGPPPTPPRPIPPADPTSAAILASLFEDAAEGAEGAQPPSAPFIDWTDPDAAAKIEEAARNIAAQTDAPSPQTLTLPKDTAQAARLIDKEQARVSYQETVLEAGTLSATEQTALEADTAARKQTLSQNAAAAAPPTSQKPLPPKTQARLSSMTLP